MHNVRNGKKDEILIIISVVFLFLISAIISSQEWRNEHLLFSVGTAVGALFLLLYWVRKGIKELIRIYRRTSRVFSSRFRGLCISVGYCFLSRMVQFRDKPHWDAEAYYRTLRNSCESFDFTARFFLNNFSMASHPSLGYAGITAIGEFLFPREYIGVLIVWMFVTMLATGCLYRIMEWLLPECCWVYHVLSTCIVMSTPLVLGTFSYYQPDAGLVCFFIFMLYCFIFKKNILLFFSMILLTQTKEVGIVVLAGFGIGFFLNYIFGFKKELILKKRIILFFKEPACISGILSVLLFGAWFIFCQKSGGKIWSYGYDSWEKGFQITPHYILYRCKEFFVLNFNWLVWCLIGILFIFLLGRKAMIKKTCGFDKKRLQVVSSVIFAYLAQIVFYAVYNTFSSVRYHVLIDFCGVFFFVVLLGNVLSMYGKYRVVGIPLLTFLGIIFLAESYTTVDPVSIALFYANDTGSGKLLSTNHLFDGGWGDFNVYNNQNNYLESAFQTVLRDVGYHEGMDVLVWSWDLHYAVLEDPSYCYWDQERKERTFQSNDKTVFIKGITNEQIDRGELFPDSEIIYFSAEQYGINKDLEKEKLAEYGYRIRYAGTVEELFRGKTSFYVCDRIE